MKKNIAILGGVAAIGGALVALAAYTYRNYMLTIDVFKSKNTNSRGIILELSKLEYHDDDEDFIASCECHCDQCMADSCSDLDEAAGEDNYAKSIES